jgi:hypothetical protein
MNSALIIGVVFGILGIVLMVFLVIVAVVFIIGLFQGWKKGSRRRQANAEAQRRRHGGRTVLEWPWPRVSGDPDPEFGELFEEFPKKGGGSARFYETGLVLDGKRVSYDTLSDIYFDEGCEERGKDLKEAIQNSAVLWLYRKGGFHRTLGIRDFVYGFDHADCEHIRDGLGFRDE